MLPGTLFIDHFIRGIFPSERKVVSWSSHPVTISIWSKTSKSSNVTTVAVNAPPSNDTHKTNHKLEELPASICMTHQVLFQSHIECCVKVTTPVSGIHSVEHKILEGTHQLTFTAHCFMDTLPANSHILISKISIKLKHLPKHMVVAFATVALMFVITAFSFIHHLLPNGTLKSTNYSA